MDSHYRGHSHHRSRSPQQERTRAERDDEKHHSRRDRDSRSRSPDRHQHHHHHGHRHRRHHKHRRASSTSHREPAPSLPFDTRPLSRSGDYVAFRPLLARYLDVQKQIDIFALDEREARGRWKSFVNKWNGAELAEGWYDPEVFQSAKAEYDAVAEQEGLRTDRKSISDDDYDRNDVKHNNNTGRQDSAPNDDDDDDDDYGPPLPGQQQQQLLNSSSSAHAASIRSQSPPPTTTITKHGPGIPSLSDLTLRREHEVLEREEARSTLRQERKADRSLQKERLEELVPARADPGTAARRLEKRREARDANARFAESKTSNDVPELADADLMGAGSGGIEEYKRLKKEAERKKTEREVRREEILRAKREEREDRIREYRQREAKTVDMLKEIAKSRFG